MSRPNKSGRRSVLTPLRPCSRPRIDAEKRALAACFLIDVEGMTFTRAAERLGISAPAVWKLHYRWSKWARGHREAVAFVQSQMTPGEYAASRKVRRCSRSA